MRNLNRKSDRQKLIKLSELNSALERERLEAGTHKWVRIENGMKFTKAK